MITTSSREKGFEAKQEGDINDHKRQHLKASQPSTSKHWSAFRNPRIVRVSRSFGGKDRHSKVCTVRGLRDRRIRLSVPTAIQLYDLQDKLGLNQPSKVIDWLIDVTKDDIDKLPPLQLPSGFGHQMLFSQQPNTSLSPFLDTNLMFNKVNNNGISFLDGDYLKQKFWGTGGETSLRGSNPNTNTSTSVSDKGKWIKISDDENQDCVVSAQKLFPLGSTHSSLMNNHLPFSSYYHFDPSNLSVSQFGASTHHGFISQTENYSSPLPSSLGSQLFLCPTTSFFPPHEPRETNHHQWLTSSSSGNNLMKNSCQNVINQGFAQRNNTINSHKDDATDS